MVTAFAPATVANVAVGFDLLGFAVTGVGDRVTVAAEPDPGRVVVEPIRGVVTDLPRDPRRNTASVALLALIEECRPPHGFRVTIDKGIPLGSGMGGSAASAVAAVVAANRLLGDSLGAEQCLRFSVAGEAAASGAPHADNAAPCLYGGLTAVVGERPPRVLELPVPAGISVVLVHPRMQIETRAARRALVREVPLARHVRQSMNLCGFLVGCFRGDLELIGASMNDLIAEPARARMIPGFDEARAAAREAGALGFSIAGSGPSVFAWVAGDPRAGQVGVAIAAAFERRGLAADVRIGPVERRGAHVVEPDGAP